MCRKLNVIPNHYLLRHSTDDDIKLRHRYLSKNDCTAMGYEMKAILFSTIPTICKLTNNQEIILMGIVCNYYIIISKLHWFAGQFDLLQDRSRG